MRNVLTRFGGFCVLAGLFSACGGDAVMGRGNANLGGNDGGGQAGSGGDAGNSSGTGGGSATGGSSSGGSGSEEPWTGPQQTSEKLDVLLVIDNSRSMADKQHLLQQSAADLVAQVVGRADDIHVGVISTSLGGHGADTCSPALPPHDPTENDNGHLLGKKRQGLQSYNGTGFLKWDPQGLASPPGEADSVAFTNALQAHIVQAGEIGCGFEAQLEAMYRFLIDPEPPSAVVKVNNQAEVQGVDQELLAERASFLRPDSSVLVVILSDEDDCSVVDGGISWLSGQGGTDEGGIFTLPRSTSACATDPNNPCCRSCNTVEAAPPAGCESLHFDLGCAPLFHSETSDALNLRCWEQKRRFGIDFLYPVTRYVQGLTAATIPNRSGVLVSNPLFAGGRDPSLISVASIVGVPWQDIAKDPSDPDHLDFMSAAELRANGRWAVIVGDPANHVPPTDPFMIASITPREGTNPVTGDPISPVNGPTRANPINGNEYLSPSNNDLQYACIFPLNSPIPRDCATSSGCDCSTPDQGTNKPLCQGTRQLFAKAYPALRELDLMRRLGDRAAVGSICARNPVDATLSDFGYRPAIRVIGERVNRTLR